MCLNDSRTGCFVKLGAIYFRFRFDTLHSLIRDTCLAGGSLRYYSSQSPVLYCLRSFVDANS